MKQPNEEIFSIHKKLCDLKLQYEVIADEIEGLENQLKDFISESEGIEGVATWKTQIRKSFDQVRFREQHPDMYSHFSKEKPYRIFRLLNKKS